MTVTIDGSASVTINSGAVLGINSATAVASTSGTSIDFTSIPSYVKRITVMFSGVSTNGSSDLVVQLGTGGTPTYTTSGYISAASTSAGTNFTATTGFAVAGVTAAANAYYGSILFSTLGTNIWVSSGSVTTGNGSQQNSGGVSLAGNVTALRLTTVGGVNTFDAGSINILYE
jgi:hypothetical protein